MTPRWPFVSRFAYDVLEAQLEATMAVLREQIARSNKLTDDLLSMKRDGFSVSPPVVHRAPAEPGPVQEAISQRAHGNIALTRHLHGWANSQLRLGVPERELADRILNWRDPEERDD